jgi:hypothetical protein
LVVLFLSKVLKAGFCAPHGPHDAFVNSSIITILGDFGTCEYVIYTKHILRKKKNNFFID